MNIKLNLIKSDAFRTMIAFFTLIIFFFLFIIGLSLFYGFITNSYFKDVYAGYSPLISLVSLLISTIISAMLYQALVDISKNVYKI